MKNSLWRKLCALAEPPKIGIPGKLWDMGAFLFMLDAAFLITVGSISKTIDATLTGSDAIASQNDHSLSTFCIVMMLVGLAIMLVSYLVANMLSAKRGAKK